MKYLAALAVLSSLALAAPAKAQEVIVSEPVVTYYAPSVPVTTYYAPTYSTYYAPSVPVTTYYAPAYTSYYAPAVAYAPAYYPGYYVSPRVARRWARNGYYW
jgi:hypothetical protein